MKVPKFICIGNEKVPDVKSTNPKVSDRAEIPSPQNSSAGLGERLRDVGDTIILEHSNDETHRLEIERES